MVVGAIRIQNRVPECLHRRYQALDELIQDLTRMMSSRNSSIDCNSSNSNSDVGIKLMCQFWNILKEDPECNLPEVVQQRMGLSNGTGFFTPQEFTCYMAESAEREKKKETVDKIKHLCSRDDDSKISSNCTSKPTSPGRDNKINGVPLSKVLCNLSEAASFDKKCNERLNDLLLTQKQLKEQIQLLEEKEKEGLNLLKKADCMWSCMEETYKKKLAAIAERQRALVDQAKEIETSNSKWRKNRKDLEVQMNSTRKCQMQLVEKTSVKKSDLKCIDTDIENYKQRIDNSKQEIDGLKKSIINKKQASDQKINSISSDSAELQKMLSEEKKLKQRKEHEGAQYVKDAREDVQKICRLLLQKKIENEDLKAEKDAVLNEIDLLNKTCDQCKDRCKNKQQSILEEIKKVDKEIAEFKVRCITCHQCEDTSDLRKFCTDCPRCLQERNCLLEVDHCIPDHTMDCVCVSVKQKFLDNVFDNMYTVLDKQAKSRHGKVVAETVLEGLKRSMNGKLTEKVRMVLQEFVLTTIKKYLNLTIIGGAVKTRCELDPDTYKQLMLCLKQVKVVAPPKADKGTLVKKEPCQRWGGTNECNCPNGPRECICNKRAPPAARSRSPMPPPEKLEEPTSKCPYIENTVCGPECAMQDVVDQVGAEIASWRPDPCHGPTCSFSKNMRAAQCVLGPETLTKQKNKSTKLLLVPPAPELDSEYTCNCGNMPMKICKCRKELKQIKADLSPQNSIGICKCKGEMKNSDEHYQDYKSKRLTKATLANIGELDFIKQLQKNKEITETGIDPVISEQKEFAVEAKVLVKEAFIDNIGEVMPNFSKVKVLGSDQRLVELPALLQLTSSHNYVIVIDKEFEKRFKETINRCVGTESECFVTLTKTLSGSYVIDLHNELITHGSERALLIKSSSDNIRILVNGPKFECLGTKAKKKDSILYNETRRSFDQLINKIKQADILNLPCSKNINRPFTIKSISDSQLLYKNITVRLEDHKGLLAEPSAVIKKNNSGNYAVIIDKESNKSFINSLKTYLSGSALVPVKNTDSGKILINLNETAEQSQSGELKMSPSGNVYIIVNEDVINGIESEARANVIDTKSSHLIGKIQKPANKGVATSCKGKPSNCCKTSKCVCKELTYDDDFDLPLKRKCASLKSKKDFFIEKKTNDVGHCNNKVNKCDHLKKEKSLSKSLSPKRVSSPKTVSEKSLCGCRPIMQMRPSVNEQCFFLVQSVCSHHHDKYNDKDATERSCSVDNINITDSDTIKTIQSPKTCSHSWDALDFLPPQLPLFLRDKA